MRHLSESNPRRLRMDGKLRSLVLLTSLLIAVVCSFFVSTSKTAFAATYCQVTYTVTNQWPGGFGATTTIQNVSGSAWTSWTLTFTFPASGQTITQLWSGSYSQSGQNVTVNSVSYNGNVANNTTVSSPPGFNGSWTSSNPVPTSFSINVMFVTIMVVPHLLQLRPQLAHRRLVVPHLRRLRPQLRPQLLVVPHLLQLRPQLAHRRLVVPHLLQLAHLFRVPM